MSPKHNTNIAQVEKLPGLCINSVPSKGEALLLSANFSCSADFHFNGKGTFACYCWYHAPRTIQTN